MLQAFLDWQRATLLYKCAGLTGEQLAERAVPPSGLSLLGLVRHMTKVERYRPHRFAGEEVDNASGLPRRPTSTRSTRLAPPPTTPCCSRRSASPTRPSLTRPWTTPSRTTARDPLRVIHQHLIHEYARHHGHADLLRERVDGATGE